jgi:pyruvate formate lyase activating enzyme
MRIGGFQKLTLIDYPGKLAATVFTQGCNFRCGYCHNPQLVDPRQFQEPIEEDLVLDFLRSRQGKLQGVVVTGGEPTIQKGLLEFLGKLKSMDYLVKLDTNGSKPNILYSILEQKLVDYVAMDIKTSLSNYPKVVGAPLEPFAIQQSIDLIKNSGIEHQFRTTLVKSYCSESELDIIQNMISQDKHYVLQPFILRSHILDADLLLQDHYTEEQFQLLQLKYQP